MLLHRLALRRFGVYVLFIWVTNRPDGGDQSVCRVDA